MGKMVHIVLCVFTTIKRKPFKQLLELFSSRYVLGQEQAPTGRAGDKCGQSSHPSLHLGDISTPELPRFQLCHLGNHLDDTVTFTHQLLG